MALHLKQPRGHIKHFIVTIFVILLCSVLLVVFQDKNPSLHEIELPSTECAWFPSVINFNDLYWQTLRTSNGNVQLFGAYLDVRPANWVGPTVRILSMIDRIEPTVTTYCQFWFEGRRKPVITKTFKYDYIWNKQWGTFKQGMYQPYLISCVIPNPYKQKIPKSISIVEKLCDNSTNNLRVIYKSTQQKKDFAVCVKGLKFLYKDISTRLAEWIELLNLLGADKIFLYELQVHPNISKVLRYYEQENKIHVTPITWAAGQPLNDTSHHSFQNELIAYNDCFYKNMYEYRYIALFDIDEVIMPVERHNWKELMQTVLPKTLKTNDEEPASYIVKHVYFSDTFPHNHSWFEDIPKYMHMLQRVNRATNFTGPRSCVKCFHNTQKVLTLHNHLPLDCLGGRCSLYSMETKDAQLHHYKPNCLSDSLSNCKELTKTIINDTTMWRFKKPLIARVSTALKNLGFLNSETKAKDCHV